MLPGDRAECIEIAKEVFARLVRACLGSSAISSRKLEHGSTLVILGIELQLDAEGAMLRPSPEKLMCWTDTIYRAVLTQAWPSSCGSQALYFRKFLLFQALSPGEASKLAGKLQWDSQSAFRSHLLTARVHASECGSDCEPFCCKALVGQ